MNTQFVDLNSSLTALLVNGTVEDVKRLVACSLTPDRVFQSIIETKRYDTIPLLIPFLQLNDNEEFCDEFARIYAQAIVDGNVEVKNQLRCLGYDLDDNQIAFHYGTLITSAEGCDANLISYSSFSHGLISVDNLDLFTILNEDHLTTYLCICSGEHRAKRMMSHFGFSSDNLKYYISGAIGKLNKETIVYLFEKVEDRKMLLKLMRLGILDRYDIRDDFFNFVRWLLSQGFLEFRECHWKRLELHQSILYNALQSDV